MKYKKVFKVSILTLAVGALTACNLTSNQAQEHGKQRQKGTRPPSISELFIQMDTNKDGKLSKREVKGPLQNDFSKIDSNGDGYLSKTELEKAPKPQRETQRKP